MNADNLDELRHQFAGEMVRGADELARLGYDASRFRRMIADHGAVEAARRLALDPRPSEGLWRLQRMHRLDMSVEMWVLLPWYEPLFDQAVLDQAERKLDLLGVDVPGELDRLVHRLNQGG
jgi:hypothetical protein